MEEIYTMARCFQERFLGLMESPSSWKVVKLVFLKKPDAAPSKGIRSYRAIAMTSVMSKWYPSCVLFTIGKGKRAREAEEFAHGWRERGHLPTLTGVDDEFIAKTLGMARGKESRDETWYSGQADNVRGQPGH